MDTRVDEGKKKQKVCIYWRQGNCWNSDEDCPFLHANVEDKVSICKFFKEYGYCNKGDECLFRHVLPTDTSTAPVPGETTAEQCPYYERGFCEKGSECKFMQHQMSVMFAMMNG